MKCQDCGLLLEEYFDGETDERAAGAIAAHLQTCAACTAIYDGLAAEQTLFASYEREVEVTPALWAGVEARLRAEQREAGGKVGFLQRLSAWLAPLLVAPRFSPAMTAAMVVLAVVATAVVMKTVGGGNTEPPQLAQAGDRGNAPAPAATPNAVASESPTPGQSAPPATAPFNTSPQLTPQPKSVVPPADPNRLQNAAGTPPKQGPKLEVAAGQRPKQGVTIDRASTNAPAQRVETAADRLVREAEQRYVAAIKILERDVKTRRERLDPDTRARFEETLASIDRTINETRKSAKQHGNDPVAVQYMLSAYAKKVEVMREMAALGQ
ncbi:MAG TPA: zf-HC2 domain-containing protein [Pyrinomonadaceae bacterium]|nr:zf-HC2 domain-containing protein [Pyrinomonadaceae bacterium]